MSGPDKGKKIFNFDSILALALIPIALYLIYYQWSMPKSAIRQALGPSFVPIALLVGMIITAVFLFFSSLQMERKGSAEAKSERIPAFLGSICNAR